MTTEHPAPADTATAADVGGPATVLVVDDAPASRYIVGSWLRRSGHREQRRHQGEDERGPHRNSPSGTAAAIAAIPASFGCRWSPLS